MRRHAICFGSPDMCGLRVSFWAVTLLLATAAPVAARSPTSTTFRRESHRYGLDGTPDLNRDIRRRGGIVDNRKEWHSPAGARWEIREYDRKGRLRHSVQGLQLNNGRYLLIDAQPRL